MKLRLVALLGRACGLDVLRDVLLRDPALDICSVFTHGRAPRAEGGGPRAELEEYRECCRRTNLALHVLDGSAAGELQRYVPSEVDLLVSVSWRNLVADDVLRGVRLGAINLHRGALPAYAGAEPVRRAIEADERQVSITAHRMTAEIDAGEEVARVSMTLPPRPVGTSPADHAETVKAKLAPLYAPLARLALDAILAAGAVA